MDLDRKVSKIFIILLLKKDVTLREGYSNYRSVIGYKSNLIICTISSITATTTWQIVHKISITLGDAYFVTMIFTRSTIAKVIITHINLNSFS